MNTAGFVVDNYYIEEVITPLLYLLTSFLSVTMMMMMVKVKVMMMRVRMRGVDPLCKLLVILLLLLLLLCESATKHYT